MDTRSWPPVLRNEAQGRHPAASPSRCGGSQSPLVPAGRSASPLPSEFVSTRPGRPHALRPAGRAPSADSRQAPGRPALCRHILTPPRPPRAALHERGWHAPWAERVTGFHGSGDSLCQGFLPLGEAGAKSLQAGVVFELFGWHRLHDPKRLFGSRPLGAQEDKVVALRRSHHTLQPGLRDARPPGPQLHRPRRRLPACFCMICFFGDRLSLVTDVRLCVPLGCCGGLIQAGGMTPLESSRPLGQRGQAPTGTETLSPSLRGLLPRCQGGVQAPSLRSPAAPTGTLTWRRTDHEARTQQQRS